MLEIVPKSSFLAYAILIARQLKWAWDYLVYQSLFQSRGISSIPDYGDDISVMRYERKDDSKSDSTECAVCLCGIEEGDEVRELRCNHLFHKACLDRWMGYGHVTCPLCRNHVKPPQFSAELHQELIVFNFTAARSRDERCMWWLR